MDIALYGGSFDPPHNGHVQVALKALEVLKIDRLIIVPAYQNPFKSATHIGADKRLKWLKTIFKPYPNIEISDFEISQKRAVYTIETVEHFAPKDGVTYLIIGSDNLASLSKWHRYTELNNAVTWVIATREGTPIPDGMIRLDVNVPISSSDFKKHFIPLGLEASLEHDILTTYKEKNESTN